MGTANDRELHDFYKLIAPHYDGDYTSIVESGPIDFYLRLARASGGPVLELGCGTGLILLPLARAGIAVHGMDASEGMLGRLRQKLNAEPPDVRERVTLTQGDIRTGDLARLFPLIISPGNVLHSFLDRGDQRGWLRTARRHLAPGGAFCFDVFQPNYRMVAAEPEFQVETDRTDPDTGHRVRRFIRAVHEPEFQRFRVDMKWVEEDASGTVLSETPASIMQRWFTRGELEILLELEGFRITDYWGDFTGAPFGKGSPEQIVRAVAAEV